MYSPEKGDVGMKGDTTTCISKRVSCSYKDTFFSLISMEALRKILFKQGWVITHYVRIHSVHVSWVLLKAQLINEHPLCER
jgi:hypothetical protein